MKRWVCLVVLACAPLFGQGMTHFELANGTAVQYQTWDGRPASTLFLPDGLRRIITDGRGRSLLVFDVHVDPVGKSALRLSFTSVAGMPFFAQAPSPRDLNPGDHVLVDVLEQAGTGKKVYDSLRVGFRDTPMQLPPMPPDAPSVIASGAVLHLDQAKLNEGGMLLAKSSGTLSGPRLRMAFPNGGQYTLSSDPGPGYDLEAVVYGGSARTRAAFSDGGNLYSVSCASAIVNLPGSWLLWVRREVSPRPVAPPAAPIDIRSLFPKEMVGSRLPADPPLKSPVPELKIWAIQ